MATLAEEPSASASAGAAGPAASAAAFSGQPPLPPGPPPPRQVAIMALGTLPSSAQGPAAPLPPQGQPPLPPGRPPLPLAPPPSTDAPRQMQPPLPPGPPPSTSPSAQPPLPPGPPPATAPPPGELPSSAQGNVALQLLVDAYCTRKADLKTKGSTRHVLIKDLRQVATALKVEIPPLGTPCALYSVFEGNPMASEWCAKGMHGKLLGRLQKLSRLCRNAEVGKALIGALLDLDVELRDSQPGLDGCSAAVALLAGKMLHVAVAGQCGIALCSSCPAVAAAKAAAPRHRWTSAAPRALNPEAVAAAARRAAGAAEPAATTSADVTDRGSLQYLHAKNPTRCVGRSAASAGAFAGRKPGALDPTAIRNAKVVAVDKGAGGLLAADDIRVEAVALAPEAHALLMLGTAGLYRGCTALELAKASLEHPFNPAAASAAAARLAQARLVHKSSDDACWVQNEKMHGFELTCITALLVWNERPLMATPAAPAVAAVGQEAVAAPQDAGPAGAAPPEVPSHLVPSVDRPAKRPEQLLQEVTAEEAATRAATAAFYSEKLKAEKRAKLADGRGPGAAAAAGPATSSGEAAERVPLDGKLFEMKDLDGTAQWRLRMARAAHMRGGDVDDDEGGNSGGKKGGKSKGKSGKGRGKGKGKGKAKGKGKGKKRKAAEVDDDVSASEGGGEEVDEEGSYEGDEAEEENEHLAGDGDPPSTAAVDGGAASAE